MARQLAQLGHCVTVVTVDWRQPGGSRLRQTAEHGVNVVRIDPSEWYPTFNASAPPFITEPPALGPLRQRLKTLRGTLGWGGHPRWARLALEALLAAHRTRHFDVVWAIHGDDSPHVVASRFHDRTGVPWVADFKDPWNVFHRRPLLPLQWMCTWRRLRTASFVTETCAAQANADQSFRRPTHVIWSGYDPEAMQDAVPQRSSTRFTLLHVGNVGTQHDSGLLSSSLGRWRSEMGEAWHGLELHVFGHRSPPLEQALAAAGVSDLLHFHGFVPREEAFARMKGADALLLLPGTRHARSGVLLGVKELEYLASGTPVLSLGRLLPEVRAAFRNLPQLVSAQGPEAAARFLVQEYESFSAHRPSARRGTVNAKAVAAYSWAVQAKRLAAVFEEAAEAPHLSLTPSDRRTRVLDDATP
jgi:glycosyltransferase involved in cell wall biosynthesis